MVVLSWILAICNIITTVGIACFAMFGVVDYFRIRRMLKRDAIKEVEDISIDNITT